MTAISRLDSISERTCASSSIRGTSMMFRGGWRNAMRATEPAMLVVSRPSPEIVGAPLIALCSSVASMVSSSQINRRLADFSDTRQRVAGAGLLGNPLLFGFENIEEQLLVGRRGHVFL